MACRFTEDELRPIGRTARGVTGMRFKIEGDEIVSMEVVPTLEEFESEEEAAEIGGPQILVVSDGGMGKRSFISNYRKTRRAAKGVVNIKLNDNESVVGAIQIQAGDEVILTTTSGQIVRIPADEIRAVGRASKGVRIMRLKDNDRITSIAKVVEVDHDENKNTDETSEDTTTETTTPVETAGIENSENIPTEESTQSEKDVEDTE